MATTTKPVLTRSGSASSERNAKDNNAVEAVTIKESSQPWKNRLLKLDEKSELSERRVSMSNRTASPSEQPEVAVKMNPAAMTSVLASLNKMKVLRQRTLALTGNMTKTTPLRKFNPTEVADEMQRILVTALKGVVYDPKRSSVLAKSLSESIKGKVKTMKFPRYKFVAMVTICSKSNQCMTNGSRCLWNSGSDSYATAHYTNDTIAAVATVFAIFKE